MFHNILIHICPCFVRFYYKSHGFEQRELPAHSTIATRHGIWPEATQVTNAFNLSELYIEGLIYI